MLQTLRIARPLLRPSFGFPLLAALAVPLAAGPTLLAWSLAAAISLLGILLAWREARERPLADAVSAPAEVATNVSPDAIALCGRVARAEPFSAESGVATRLEALLAAAERAIAATGGDLLAENRADLAAVLVSLRATLDVRGVLLADVKKLANLTGELQRMAAEVGGFAGRSNLLAVNAAVRAELADGAGGELAVLAEEVRKLALASADTGRRIDAMVENIGANIVSTLSAADRYARIDQETLAVAEATMNAVLARVGRALAAAGTAAAAIWQEGEFLRQDLHAARLAGDEVAVPPAPTLGYGRCA